MRYLPGDTLTVVGYLAGPRAAALDAWQRLKA